MSAPYMWYQNDRHFPPLAVVPGTFELISFAASFGFLGDDVSMYMYHPFAESVQHNTVKVSIQSSSCTVKQFPAVIVLFISD